MSDVEQLGLFDHPLQRREEVKRGQERRDQQMREHHEHAHRYSLERACPAYGLVICPECDGDERRSCWKSRPCPHCAGHWWLWADGRQLTHGQFWHVLQLEEPDVVWDRALL